MRAYHIGRLSKHQIWGLRRFPNPRCMRPTRDLNPEPNDLLSFVAFPCKMNLPVLPENFFENNIRKNKGVVMLDNPFWLGPADEKYFVGRQDLLDSWKQRLKPDTNTEKSLKNWLVVAEGGMGKTSLLTKLRQVAQEEFKAHTIFVDLGFYRDCNNPTAFFETFNSQIGQAGDFGSKVRKLLQLAPDTSEGKVLLKSIGYSLKLAGLGITLSPLFQIGPSFPDALSNNPEDIAVCFSIVFNGLRAITERGGPVVVLVDQLGKAHDSPLWCNIARLLLSNLLMLFEDGLSEKIIFVFSIRPERFGWLDYQIQQPQLFSDNLLERKYLKSFDENEAREAIRSRGKAHITQNIISGIIGELNRSGKYDPYTVIQAAAAVWIYLYGGSKQRSPVEMDAHTIQTAITNFYIDLTRHFKQYPLQWAVVKLLALYQGGLTTDEIVERLHRPRSRERAQTLITSKEAEDILHQLLDQKGYQIISSSSRLSGNPRYMIAHELLRDAINSQNPKEQQAIEQAGKTLVEAVARYQQYQDILTDNELQIIWQYRDWLQINAKELEAISSSLLKKWNSSFSCWLTWRNQSLTDAILRFLKNQNNELVLVRGYIILSILNNSGIFLTKAFVEIARFKNENKNDFIKGSIKGLVKGGQKEETQKVLADLVRTSEDDNVRLMAAEGLAQLGNIQVALDVLVDLARRSADKEVRQEATGKMAEMREPAQAILVDLVRNSNDYRVRHTAAKGLGKVGETTRDMLEGLARRTDDEWVSLGAAEGLAQLGDVQVAQDVLSNLAHRSEDRDVRQEATEGLVQLGEPAQVVLTDLAHWSADKWVSERATEGLLLLGERARDNLAYLAFSGVDDQIRRKAVMGLAQLGKTGQDLVAFMASNDHEDSLLRMITWEVLKALKATAPDELEDLARSSKNENVLQDAAKGLAKVRETQETREVLANLARSSEDEQLRQNAAEKLAKLGEKVMVFGIALSDPLGPMAKWFFLNFYEGKGANAN
jgi:hypothetical protein